jgi:signal transduction histidine kinase
MVLAGRRALGLRSAMVARACHELRGPITAARLGLSLGEPTADRLRAIETELGRATAALDDLAGASAGASAGAGTDAGRRPVQVDVTDVTGCCVEAARGLASRHGCSVAAAWEGAPGIVWGSRERLAQAVANLITNAIEHGGGRVTISGVARAGAVRIEVGDEGPGLPAPLHELLRAGHRHRDRRGHGLAVADAVARAHGGGLRWAPAASGGRMVLELPLVARA